MNAYLHLDDDLASYLSEQAKQEHTTLDVVLNRLLRRAVPEKQKAASKTAASATPTSLVDFFLNSPLCDSGIEIMRDRSGEREDPGF